MTRDKILEAAYKMAVVDGLDCLTRDAVAAGACVSKGAINHHFKTIENLRTEVMKRAVEMEDLKLIAQGIACDNEVAQSAPHGLRVKALSSLA